ncbi:hypothetical protein PYCC9005_002991 [Savitreella phatthalungensis]
MRSRSLPPIHKLFKLHLRGLTTTVSKSSSATAPSVASRFHRRSRSDGERPTLEEIENEADEKTRRSRSLERSKRRHRRAADTESLAYVPEELHSAWKALLQSLQAESSLEIKVDRSLLLTHPVYVSRPRGQRICVRALRTCGSVGVAFGEDSAVVLVHADTSSIDSDHRGHALLDNSSAATQVTNSIEMQPGQIRHLVALQPMRLDVDYSCTFLVIGDALNAQGFAIAIP